MMKSISCATALTLASMVLPTAANASTVLGDSVTCVTNTFPSSRCNGNPTDTQTVVDDIANPEFRIFAVPNFDPLFTIDFGNGFLTLRSLGDRSVSSTILQFINNNRGFATISGGGDLASRATITNGVISLNLAGRTFTNGQEFTFDVTAVPEPGTWMLMILGLGAVGFSMRRRQKTSVRHQFA